MSDKKKPKKEKSKSQRERFIETARELESDESGASFDSAFQKILAPRTPTKIK